MYCSLRGPLLLVAPCQCQRVSLIDNQVPRSGPGTSLILLLAPSLELSDLGPREQNGQSLITVISSKLSDIMSALLELLLDSALWAPIRAPEWTIGALLALAGAASSHYYPDVVLVQHGAHNLTLGTFLAGCGVAVIALLRPRWPRGGAYGVAARGSLTTTEQGSVRIQGDRFVDESGRTLLLRGVNLSANAKLPTQPACAASTNIPVEPKFFDHRAVSFVGRPFPLDTADEHFGRLRAWGLTFLRLLVTWEAVEHGGPGVYDDEYLEYLLAIVRKAAQHGITVFIDPHMDVWSRFTGGDGAPGWTLEAARRRALQPEQPFGEVGSRRRALLMAPSGERPLS